MRHTLKRRRLNNNFTTTTIITTRNTSSLLTLRIDLNRLTQQLINRLLTLNRSQGQTYYVSKHKTLHHNQRRHLSITSQLLAKIIRRLKRRPLRIISINTRIRGRLMRRFTFNKRHVISQHPTRRSKDTPTLQQRMFNRRIKHGRAHLLSNQCLFDGIFGLTSVTPPMVVRRRLTHHKVRHRNKRTMLRNRINNRFTRRRQGILQALTRHQGNSQRHTRTMVRVLTRTTQDSNLLRVRIHNHSSTSINLLSLQQASACRFTHLRRTRRTHLHQVQRFNSLIRRSHAPINLLRVTLTNFRHSNRKTFLITRGLQISHTFKGNHTISNCVFVIFTNQMDISSLQRGLLTRTTFTHSRCHRINQDRTRNSLRHPIRGFQDTSSTRTLFSYNSVHRLFHGKLF